MNITEENNNGASKKNADEAPQVQALHEFISSIKHKFLVISSQGGVGQTSVVVNLALSLSNRGAKVGLLDTNPYNPDIFSMLGLKSSVTFDTDKRVSPISYSDTLKAASIESVMQDKEDNGLWEKPLKISDIRRFISGVSWDSLDFLFVDTPPLPGEEFLTVMRAFPDANIIIVTAPNKISEHHTKKMINFFRKEKIQIFGWIENMRGFLCQQCGQPQELFSTGAGNRAVFFLDIPFLGRIPIDPHMVECAEAGEAFMEKCADSETATACNLIAEKIFEGNKANLLQD